MRASLQYSLVLLASVSAVASSGCGAFDPPPPPAPFKAVVRVMGDPDEPLFGATLTSGKLEPIVTGVDGRANLLLTGAEGDVRQVMVTCPAGHQQPREPLTIRLTRFVGDRVPTYDVACPPLRRKVVVAVRAENGPYLPVKYLNQVVATTDAGGAAHFALELEPGSFSVVLDTTERKDLKPPSPGSILSVGDRDDILVLDQRFTVIKKPPPPKKGPVVPVDISKRRAG